MTQFTTYLILAKRKGSVASTFIKCTDADISDKALDFANKHHPQASVKWVPLGSGEPTFKCRHRTSLFTAEQADAYQCGYAGSPLTTGPWWLKELSQRGYIDLTCEEERNAERQQLRNDATAEMRDALRGDL